jgi:hypothetical protein
VGGLVRHVEEVLGRAHALFGGPDSAGGSLPDSGGTLTDALQALRGAHWQMSGQQGALPARYSAVAGEAARNLDTTASMDARLARRVHTASRALGAGRGRSAAAVTGARRDAASLMSEANTPAGQRVLIAALRARLVQQQRIVAACKQRDVRLAAALRSLGYGPSPGRPRRTPLSASVSGTATAPGTGHAAGVPRAAPLRPVTLAGSVHPAPSLPLASVPGTPVGTPLGALTPDSSPREVASAIVREAHRRGYSPYQITAILADALQESNLNPRAQSPNKLWYSIFQQDSSYPGRHNPNLAIAEFFNRLDHHGGPASPDIWKSIFWLQQRPGEPSAQVAFAHGRPGYLREIQRQMARAIAVYRDIVAG